MTDSKKLFFGLKRSAEHDPKIKTVNFCLVRDLPSHYSLRNKIQFVYNQGNMNSCSANAVCQQLLLSDIKNSLNGEPQSRLYIYYNSRMIDRGDCTSMLEDSGATIPNVYKSIVDYSSVPEEMYEYNINLVNLPAPQHIYHHAIFKTTNPIMSYKRIDPVSLYSIKYCISVLKLPIMFGMSVFENFITLTRENNLIDTKVGDLIGLHAVLLIGYNDLDQTVTILNSHGPDFGDGGFFRMSYQFLMDPSLCFEYYVINSEQKKRSICSDTSRSSSPMPKFSDLLPVEFNC